MAAAMAVAGPQGLDSGLRSVDSSAWLRRMRWAQAGAAGFVELPATAPGVPGALPPTVPAVDEPPVAAKLDRAPAAKLCRMELAA